MEELLLKIMRTGCPDLKAHLRIMCSPPDKKFVHPFSHLNLNLGCKNCHTSVLMTTEHNTAQISSDNLPFSTPDNQHCSDTVYL